MKTLLVVLFALSSHSTFAMATRNVIVTGAAGKTGRIVLQKLLDRPGFQPTGVVRTDTSQAALQAEFSSKATLVVADICDPKALQEVFENQAALIICTSATPAPTGEFQGERPVFGFPNGQPEQVDWIGQKHQIDAAKAAGISHIVVCSSMGGTNPDNPLNKLGRDDNGKGGNILLWKRKAEKYLIR